ncbi:MAG: Zn-dependent protease-like protein [Segetibacter sp.]|nr:Zn-dependent protease-like protein [Segetibacter sp.]
MKHPIRRILYCIVVSLFITMIHSCDENHTGVQTKSEITQNKVEKISLIIIPLGNVPVELLKELTPKFQIVSSNVRVQNPVNLPKLSYYPPRGRYRADSLISWLSKQAKLNEVYVGITTVDISTTLHGDKDWGVMGLGYSPGNACVISSKRLKNKSADSFFKVIIHEIGHTSGLPHCPIKECYMRDAEGGDHTAEEKGFCEKCTNYLRTKGWNI